MADRWFTDAAAAGPAAIRPTFTEFETSHFTAIVEFARHPANRHWELLRCLDAAGTCMHTMSIGIRAAPVTDQMKEAIKSGAGVRQWHNHPSQDSLSHHDWICAATTSDIEVLALNERGSIFVGRMVEWDERLSHVFPWLPRLGADLESHMGQISKLRQLDISVQIELSKFTGHVLNSALAACCPVRYAYCFVPDDQTILDACLPLCIVEDGQAFALKAIKRRLSQASGP